MFAPSAPSMSPEIFGTIEDKYATYEELQNALREQGFEGSNLIFGIDFTASNKDNGRNSFGGYSLHAQVAGFENPYERAIKAIGRTLEVFDDDKLIPTYGFGDASTGALKVFSLKKAMGKDVSCYGFEEVLACYKETLKTVQLSGPTSFSPIIKKGIEIVKQTKSYHILVIVADGQISQSCKKATINAIVEASSYPLSIIMVGVGDGGIDGVEWKLMHKFDDEIPERKFDNFQFVNYEEVIRETHNPDVAFAVACCQELPEQYRAIGELRLLENIMKTKKQTKKTKYHN